MKRKISLITMIIGVIFVLLGFCLLFEKNVNTNNNKYYAEINLQDYEKIYMCTDEKLGCPILYDKFDKVIYDTNIDEISKLIDSINGVIVEKYNNVVNSSIDNSNCTNQYASTYKYGLFESVTFSIFSDEDIASISYISSTNNLCSNDYSTSFTTYTYDINEGKYLTTSEIKDKYSITDEILEEKIAIELENYNDLNNTDLTTDMILNSAYDLYFEYSGVMYLNYYNENTKTYLTVAITE